MARPSDTETDSAGVSAESDASSRKHASSKEVRRVPGEQPADNADLREYAQSLGADPEDHDLAWVVREAFEAPLPTSWTEHVDAEGRVYFFNQVSEESTWSHPMDGVYRDLIAFIAAVKTDTCLEQRAVAVREHLMEVHGRALAHLEGWSGPYNSETGLYYYNERLDQSTWVSPIAFWEYELAVRHSVLHRSLLAGYAWPEDPPKPSGGAADLLTTPMLQLPLGLARREDDEKSSARSFYTARESARSGTSNRSEQFTPDHRIKSKAAAAAAAAAVGEHPPVPPTKDGPAAPVPGKEGHKPAREQDDVALDSVLRDEVTFGRTGALTMPKVGTT